MAALIMLDALQEDAFMGSKIIVLKERCLWFVKYLSFNTLNALTIVG
jgi:hypothetical protein